MSSPTGKRWKCPHPEKKLFRGELDAKLWALRQVVRFGERGKPYRCGPHWHVFTPKKRTRSR